MSDKKLIVIVGATGTQGGSTVRTFLADPAWKVRAITRNASSSKAQALKNNGAEVVEADLNDAASLETAFEGAYAIFGVTDFWTLYADQSLRKDLEPGQAMNELVFEREIQQGRNVFDAAAKVTTLYRLVFSTLPNTKKWSGGKYTKAFHLDSKALAAEYGQQTYPELWSKTSLIQLGYYLTNLSLNPWTRPIKDAETGIYNIHVFNPDSNMPFVATEEDTGPLVKELLQKAPGTNLIAYRKRMTMKEYTKLWSKVLGVEAQVVQGNMDQAPEELKQELEDTFNWAKEYGMFGEKVNKALTMPEELEVYQSLGSIEDWIRAQDWSDVIKA